ncbi:MAG TPA: beta-propeller domain-containing protein [Allosphingosinicella sp.]|nr:beta-propeller domain-containing protein [Allosphingosinicella sp.]
MGVWRSFVIVLALAAAAGGAAPQPRDAYDGDLIADPGEPPPRPTYHKPDPERARAAAAALTRFDSPTLVRFGGDDEFRRYLGAVLAAERARSGWYGLLRRPIRFAQAGSEADVQSDAVEPICPPTDPECAAEADSSADMITVTGSRIAAPANRAVPVAQATNGQITNNQMRNVEEGDIVKQINHYLLVLQDGRIFVIDTRARGGRRLALADRANVYRDPREDMWYDEMLVFGDRVLVTGYSYRQDATELSVFRLDGAGRLSREGVFYISSNDYYSSSNYATRLIGDNLVIYTPFAVADMAQASFRWPVVRRWLGDESRDAAIRRGRPLFDAADIYRPVRAGEDPTVHTVSVCPLGPVGRGRELECRTTAFVGPNTSQWYVTETDAFLWTTSRDSYSYDAQACDSPRLETDLAPALVYRVPVDGAPLGLVGARGVPPDQFSLHSVGGRLLALLKARPRRCGDEPDPEARLAYLDIALSRFGDTLRETPWQLYTPLPGVGSHYIANRFTDRYLVYGSLGRYRRGRSENARPPVFAVPVDAPGDARGLGVGHTVLRAEQAGGDIVLTGYRDLGGLFVTLIDLDRKPRIASSVRLAGRYESEGRSHAFNSLIEPDGSGLMGLPTIRGETWSSRAAWRSSASDLSFLRVDGRGRLHPIGELERRYDYGDDRDDVGVPGYSCEVSCIDWYGNSRPIFTDGRVFALTGTEMIEGRISAGEIHEVQRLNIARASAALAATAAASGGSD